MFDTLKTKLMYPVRIGVEYPTKDKRLEQLDAMGLNIADFVHFAPGQFNVSKARELFDKYKCVSVRTFSDREHEVCLGPVKYEIGRFEEVERFCRENTREYHLLVNQAISVKDAIITGKIMWLDDVRYYIDYFHGAGTPRNVDNMGGDLRVVGGLVHRHDIPLSPDRATNMALYELVEKTKNVPQSLKPNPVLLEFQFYPYQIGRRKERLIFWEWLT